MSYHRSRARRNVRMVQISAVGLLGLAGLLAAMPAPQAPLVAPPARPAQAETPAASTPAPLDLSTLAGVWGRVHKTEVIVQPPLPEPLKGPEKPIGPAPIAGDGEPHFQFIGMISTPRRTYAYISDQDGKSQFLAQGDYVGEYLILGISSEKMVLGDCKDEDKRHEILISERPANPPVEASNVVGSNPAAMSTGAMTTGEMPPNFANGLDPREQERRQLEARNKLNELKDAAARNGTQPPIRPGPTNQPRPMSPKDKTGTKK